MPCALCAVPCALCPFRGLAAPSGAHRGTSAYILALSNCPGLLVPGSAGLDVRHTYRVRLEIHVRPNANRTVVGGTHNGALVVRVAEPAKRGKATAAALAAVAEALSVPRRLVTLVRGTASHRKVVEVMVDEQDERAMDDLVARLRDL